VQQVGAAGMSELEGIAFEREIGGSIDGREKRGC
jgi:hypothetical protein